MEIKKYVSMFVSFFIIIDVTNPLFTLSPPIVPIFQKSRDANEISQEIYDILRRGYNNIPLPKFTGGSSENVQDTFKRTHQCFKEVIAP